MSDNTRKTPLVQSLSNYTKKSIAGSLQREGQCLPCHVVANDNSIVTVAFDVQSAFTLPTVKMPVYGFEYVRYPIQVGDKGLALPADVYLGGQSGLGTGTATLVQPSNLGALVFLPFSNTAWSDVDPDAVTIYGPNGVVLRNTDSTSSLILVPGGIALVGEDYVTITVGSTVLTINAAGFSLVGAAGTIEGDTSLRLQDATNYTAPSVMASAWTALNTWLNAHVHSDPHGGNSGVPTVPFSGGSIAPHI